MAKQIRRALSVAGLAALAAFGADQAAAAEKGDWLVRVGVTAVRPNDDSGRVNVQGLGPLDGTGVTVDNDTRPSFTIGYMLTDNLALELIGALPFKHDIGGKGLGIDDIGSTKHLPPTLSLQYHFNVTPAFKPYVGAGLNYTIFFEEKLSGAVRDDLGFTKMELDNSLGWALQLGADVELGGGWLLNADVRYIDIGTEATLKAPDGSRAKVDVDIDPWVFTLAAGKRF